MYFRRWLTSLISKTLVNLGIYGDIFSGDNKHTQNKFEQWISKSNIEFFNENILNIKKLCGI